MGEVSVLAHPACRRPHSRRAGSRFVLRSQQDVLQRADVVIGHVEVPHTTRGVEASSDVPAPPSDPAHLLRARSRRISRGDAGGQPHFRRRTERASKTRWQACATRGFATTGAGAHARLRRGSRRIDRSPGTARRRAQLQLRRTAGLLGRCRQGRLRVRAGDHALRARSRVDRAGPPRIYTFAEPETLDAHASGHRCPRRARGRDDRRPAQGHRPHPGRCSRCTSARWRRRRSTPAPTSSSATTPTSRGASRSYRDGLSFMASGNFVTVTRALNVEANASPGAARVGEAPHGALRLRTPIPTIRPIRFIRKPRTR